MTDRKKIGWGLIGASDIAKTRMIEAINGQPDSAVVAVMSTNEERAKRYAADNHIPHYYFSVEALLADPNIDVVGEDGVRSLAVATAVLESTKTGQRAAVRY